MVKRKWDSSSGFYPSLRNLVQVDSGGWREDLRPVTLGAWQRLPVGDQGTHSYRIDVLSRISGGCENWWPKRIEMTSPWRPLF